MSVPAPNELGDLALVTDALKDLKVEIDEIALRRPTLDDAFLALTGQPRVEEKSETSTGLWAPNLEESHS
jgi:hypothetical protein